MEVSSCLSIGIGTSDFSHGTGVGVEFGFLAVKS
jgi:hypothetical protein